MGSPTFCPGRVSAKIIPFGRPGKYSRLPESERARIGAQRLIDGDAESLAIVYREHGDPLEGEDIYSYFARLFATTHERALATVLLLASGLSHGRSVDAAEPGSIWMQSGSLWPAMIALDTAIRAFPDELVEAIPHLEILADIQAQNDFTDPRLSASILAIQILTCDRLGLGSAIETSDQPTERGHVA